MRIEYKRTALLDLQQTQDYIINTLKNKPAAHKLVSSILHAVSLLSDNPMMGIALNSRYDVDSNIWFLVVSKQFVFYRIFDDSLISISRILDGRQDYMPILFKLERFNDAQALTVCSARKCWVRQRNG